MIEENVVDLDPTEPEIAASIHRVMIAAYQVEADLLGVTDFVPLQRTAAQIARADSAFVGIWDGETLARTHMLEVKGRYNLGAA